MHDFFLPQSVFVVKGTETAQATVLIHPCWSELPQLRQYPCHST
jgi:hypothetical protein